MVHGVDKYDCWELKKIFGYGQDYDGITPISIIDFENILDNGFKDIELIPIHIIEYYQNRDELIKFLLKVPIIKEFDTPNQALDLNKLDTYILRNTYKKGIRLVRRYYGIYAKK